ncbi:MAG: redoxin domain-containing protein [Phycisphaerae bacterium]
MTGIVLTCTVIAAFLTGAAGELGTPAASLEISDWVKGAPVKIGQDGTHQAYVVEFWATWCPPCRTSIPHLTALQQKFGSDKVAIIGVSAEEAARVREFVDEMGDKMGYTVAVDSERKTTAGYMGAFKINGIPHAFVVNKAGDVVWHGHPMDEAFETALADAVAGKLDPAADRVQTLADAYFAAALEPSADSSPKRIIDQVLKDSAGNVAILTGLASALAEKSEGDAIMRRHAFQLAHAAVKATKAHNPLATETLAAIYFRDGNLPRAIRYQKLAIRDTPADSPELSAREAKLAEYHQAKPQTDPAKESDTPAESSGKKVG